MLGPWPAHPAHWLSFQDHLKPPKAMLCCGWLLAVANLCDQSSVIAEADGLEAQRVHGVEVHVVETHEEEAHKV